MKKTRAQWMLSAELLGLAFATGCSIGPKYERPVVQSPAAYKELTGPILQWYGSSVVRTVDGGMAAEMVRSAIEVAVLEAMSSAPVGK